MANFTLAEISKMDEELHELQALYSKTKIHIGLQLAKRLKAFDDEKLYLKLDEQSYPNFQRYLESVGIKYSTAREIIGLYETYVLVAGFTIKELADYAYSKLTIMKTKFFEKKEGQYLLTTTKTELNKWLAEAKSDITQEDLRQKIREDIAGEHEHDWQHFKYKICRVCKLKEGDN